MRKIVTRLLVLVSSGLHLCCPKLVVYDKKSLDWRHWSGLRLNQARTYVSFDKNKVSANKQWKRIGKVFLKTALIVARRTVRAAKFFENFLVSFHFLGTMCKKFLAGFAETECQVSKRKLWANIFLRFFRSWRREHGKQSERKNAYWDHYLRTVLCYDTQKTRPLATTWIVLVRLEGFIFTFGKCFG